MMDASMVMFGGVVAAGVAAWSVGLRMGRGAAGRAWGVVVLATGLLVVWAWLVWNPAVAVRAIPVPVLSRIEGVGALPLFMLILGVAWSRSGRPRQRAVVCAAVVVGVVHLMRGGGWMLRPTPVEAFATTVDRQVLQSQDFSCVAAASATALNQLGVYTTEAEMAQLTRTTPGNGATLVRAMDGLTQRLRGTGYHVELVQPTIEQVLALPMPVLATVQSGALQRHMIVVEHADGRYVSVMDPAGGRLLLTLEEFGQAFTGVALVFVR